jgi:hypothetical protein
MAMFTRPRRWLAVIGALAIAGSVLVSTPQPAQAANPVDFDPGYIISDAQFYNASAMNEGQIQAFMRGMLPGCAQANGVPCLPNYAESTVTRAATSRCAVYEGAASEPASRIINKVAKACGINPQVILATLQKENGLVTKQSPTAGAYRTAMGYACPDTAACDAAYFGFFNQVYSAASQFIRYGVNPSSWRYRPGAVAVQYHPNAACGSTVVNIQNKATAALYNYTPYQPNAAAMANLGGTGDACSSYGNRNFWVYFSDWFGSPTGKINPVGSLDIAALTPGAVRVAGWVFDPDTKAATDVHVYVNGVGASFPANNERPDLPPVFGDVGTQHGFDVSVPIRSGGAQNVCVYGINQGPGANVLLGCRTLQALSGSPIGVIDSISYAAGQITVKGWALDPDTTASIPVHVYDGASGLAFTADVARPDIAAAYPGYGAAHGYSATFPASGGLRTICVYGIDIVAPGANSGRGCVSINVQGGSPFGVLDSVSAVPGAFVVSGWSIDPETASSIPVHVYAGGNGFALTADGQRPDVAAVYPGFGPSHGFQATIPATPGTYPVCAYGINVGAGSNNGLGCRTLTALSGSQIGIPDSVVAANGAITTSGWAIDPDTADSVSVRIEVDGVSQTVLANASRPDLAGAYPLYGPLHGYTSTTPVAPGPHRVCVMGINVGPGADNVRGCADVVL